MGGGVVSVEHFRVEILLADADGFWWCEVDRVGSLELARSSKKQFVTTNPYASVRIVYAREVTTIRLDVVE